MRNLLFLSTVIFLLQSCGSKNYQFIDNTVTINSEGGSYQIAALSENIIKVTYSDSITYGDRNYSPVLTTPVQVTVTDTDQNNLVLSTQNVDVKIQIDPPAFSFWDKSTGLKLGEEEGYSRDSTTTKLRFNIQDNEAFYGTGARAIDMNRRGQNLLIYNKPHYGYQNGADALNYTIPHVMSSSKYMLLVDNPAKANMDLGKTQSDILEYSSEGGNMAYYFINGQSYKELMNNYTNLTGKQPLVPIWAMGHLQSRFGYRSQAEAEEILQKALDAGYPVDAIILDIYWFGPELEDGQMGRLDWDLDKWPEPKKMISDFAEKGVKTITVSEPFFTKKSSNFQYLSDNKLLALNKEGNTMTIPNFYFGEAGLLDIFKPEAKDWLWNEYKKQKEYGIAGWWVDLGEPEMHPQGMMHINGSADEVHGAVGHEWTKTMFEGYAREFPKERFFKLGRAGFAGSHRYGLIPWSGDVGRSWSGLQAQPSILLSMGISGLGYMHSDAGGFSMGEQNAELYIRWMQYAAFTAIFRPHGDANAAPSEPVLWDEKTQELVRPSVELRYKLLPYNYTLAWKNNSTGVPLARPMFMEFENVSDTIESQYMWGESFLVAPIMNPGVSSKNVYFPSGNWYNYWDNSKVTSTGYEEVTVTMQNIPVFVKEGSFIPSIQPIQNTEEYDAEEIDVTYYLSSTLSSDKLYIDDGITPQIPAQAEFQLLEFDAKPEQDNLMFMVKTLGPGIDGITSDRTLNFTVVGLNGKIKSVTHNNTDIEFKWDESTNLLKFEFNPESQSIIKIEYN
ncbi:MAG: DUF4968 domain-containing protein [bacterium]|nr:DUF4968 domain-containing protein [bacterium]